MGKEIIIKNVLERREAGFLYFIDGEGNVCRTKKGVGKKGSRKPRPKTKEELLLINNERKRKWRAKQKNKNNNTSAEVKNGM